MNRFEARILKLEDYLRPPDDDELAGLDDVELTRRLHAICQALIEHPESTASEVAKARQRKAELEAEIWDHMEFRRRPDIAAAIVDNRGFRGHSSYPDWEPLAKEWGLIDANGNLAPRPIFKVAN